MPLILELASSFCSIITVVKKYEVEFPTQFKCERLAGSSFYLAALLQEESVDHSDIYLGCFSNLRLKLSLN